MFMHSWQIVTLPKFRVTSTRLIRSVSDFKPWGTSEDIGSPSPDTCRGSTVWGATFKGESVGLAWEWVSVRPGVIAMGDPMTILTNLEIVAGDGTNLQHSEKLLKLHELIFALPWQTVVRDARWPREHRLAA